MSLIPSQTISLADLPPCKGGLSRRGFCTAAGAGLVSLGLAACTAPNPRVGVGGLDGTGGGVGGGGGGGGEDGGAQTGGQDGGAQNSNDLSSGGSPPDLSHGQIGGNCPTGVNAGQASAIAVGTAKHVTDNQTYDLLVCRDSGGLYALSASCPHAGCTVKKQGSQLWCPCHGATFDLNGQNPTSPAFSPLDHYSLCVDGSGNVIVDPNAIVAASTRT